MQTTTFKLTDPLDTHKGLIHSLELKAPTARSFINYGSPYVFVKGEVVPEWKAVFGFLSDMTGIEVGILGDIAAVDVLPLFNALSGLLVARPPNGSTQSTA